MASLGTGFDPVLTRAAAAVLVGAAAWAVLVAASLVAEAVTHGRLRLAQRLGCPRVVRAWLLGVVLALFAGVVPAQAHEGAPGSGIDSALDGLPLPERPDGHRARPTASRSPYVVQPGDSLWTIAGGRLRRGDGEAEVAAAVASLYAANRSAIGPDPDLLTPGERLHLPHDFPAPTPSLEAP